MSIDSIEVFVRRAYEAQDPKSNQGQTRDIIPLRNETVDMFSPYKYIVRYGVVVVGFGKMMFDIVMDIVDTITVCNIIQVLFIILFLTGFSFCERLLYSRTETLGNHSCFHHSL